MSVCSLVVTAAGLLGVQVSDALEAYGLYFVQHVADQVGGLQGLLAVQQDDRGLHLYGTLKVSARGTSKYYRTVCVMYIRLQAALASSCEQLVARCFAPILVAHTHMCAVQMLALLTCALHLCFGDWLADHYRASHVASPPG